MRFVLKGFPPSVNAMRVPRGGRITTSIKWRSWVAWAAKEFERQAAPFIAPLFTRQVKVRIWLYGFGYRGDIDNLVKAGVDALEVAGIVGDDRWVEQITIARKPKGRVGVRTVIWVTGDG